MPLTAPNYALEQSICNYLTTAATASGSALSGSIFMAYTGIGNISKDMAPAVVVDCSNMREVVPFSRNYEFSTKVTIYEMAADTPSGSVGVLAQGIFNEFVDSRTASGNFSNPAEYNINVFQVQTESITPSFDEDAFTNTIECRIIAALVPSN